MKRSIRAVLLLLIFGGILAQGDRSHPRSERFPARAAALSSPGGGTFVDSGQSLGNAISQGVAQGDLDGDGDPDAFVANDGANEVWLNDGFAQFSSNGQFLGSLNSEDVALGDLDGDGDLDAVIANNDGLNQVWLNDGGGQFTAGQAFENSLSRGIALGDLDGDGDLDVFVANSGGETVWLNDGGVLSDSLQSLGTSNSYGAALGDLDGDGDLDAFVANNGSDEVWINQGGAQGGTPGVFADSGQSLGAHWTYAAALGDLDGDGDLDAFTASWSPNDNKVWINQGGAQGGAPGVFADSGQSLGTAASLGVALGDVDGDGDLDAFVANSFPDGSRVWLNDGAAGFSDSGQALGTDTTSYDAGLADLDGDGDPDAFVANFGPNKVWLNAVGPPAAFFDVERETNKAGDDVYYWASTKDAFLPVMLTYPAPLTTTVYALAETATGTVTETIDYATGEQVKFLNLVNPTPDPSETITLTLSVPPQGSPPGPGDETDRLLLVFVDADQGLVECILCYIEWLARFLGFNPVFGALHHMDLPDQQASPLWPYYTSLYDFYAPEMAGIVAMNPPVLWSALKTLDGWTPHVQSLADGNGSGFTIAQEMVADAVELVEGIKAHAGPSLAAAIQQEQDALDLPSFAGLNMDQAWQEIQERRSIDVAFVTLILK